MNFLNLFHSKTDDPELGRLQKIVRDAPNLPDPQIDLAEYYFNSLQSSDDWNEELAKKGFDSFHKAFKLASKISSEEADRVLLGLMESAFNLGRIYSKKYSESEYDEGYLIRIFYVLESTLKEVQSNPKFVSDVNEQLGRVWTGLGMSKFASLSNNLNSDLNYWKEQVNNCMAKAENYAGLTPEIKEFQLQMAEECLDMGEELAEQTDGSPLYDNIFILGDIWEQKSRPVHDNQREEAARKAVDLLEYGLRWLEKFTDSDENLVRYENAIEKLGFVTARYFILYAAHSKVEDAIPILENGLNSCSDDAFLHFLMGYCYSVKGDQIRSDFHKTVEWLPDTVLIAGGQITQARAKGMYKNAIAQFDRAHELDPENYLRGEDLISLDSLFE